MSNSGLSQIRIDGQRDDRRQTQHADHDGRAPQGVGDQHSVGQHQPAPNADRHVDEVVLPGRGDRGIMLHGGEQQGRRTERGQFEQPQGPHAPGALPMPEHHGNQRQAEHVGHVQDEQHMIAESQGRIGGSVDAVVQLRVSAEMLRSPRTTPGPRCASGFAITTAFAATARGCFPRPTPRDGAPTAGVRPVDRASCHRAQAATHWEKVRPSHRSPEEVGYP